MAMTKKMIIPVTSIGSFIAALVIGAIVIALNGDNPLVAYAAMFEASFNGMYNIANTLASATPLIFTGLGVAVAFKAGIANIGAEGQLYMGAITAAVIGIFVKMPAPLLLPLALCGSFISGGLYAYIPALLKVKTDTNEVVTTLMLNYVATLFTSYLVNHPLKAKGAPMGMTVEIQQAAKLPLLYAGSRFNAGFLLAIAAAILISFFFTYTTAGYEMRMQGQNPVFARYIGVDSKRRIIESMFISGGLSGIGGAILVLGIQYRFVQNISPGYGFDGLTIALMAAFNPYGVLPISLLFGALRSGSLSMELNTNVPSELNRVIQAVVILFMAAQSSFAGYFNDFLTRLNFRKTKKRGHEKERLYGRS